MKTFAFWLLPLLSVSLISCSQSQTVPMLTPVTAADMVGPNGLVYPDFTRAGVPGGIPSVAAKARVEDFGAVAGDEQDDSAAIQKAIDSLGEGGGAVTFGAGRFLIDQTVKITRNGVVLRGAGAGKTVILPRFEGQALNKQGGVPGAPVFLFSGISHPKRVVRLLTAPVVRGQQQFQINNAKDFLPGEAVFIGARKPPAEIFEILGPEVKAYSTTSYDRSVEGNYFHAQWRQNVALVQRVEGDTVFLDRPQRHDLPFELEPFADLNSLTLRGCGIENLSVEQEVAKTDINGIEFKRTFGCWVRDVAVKRIGSLPITIEASLNFEINNIELDDVNSRGGGGVGSIGINYSHDGLIQNSSFRRLRHVSVSFFSSGNVFRNCTLRNVDFHFHLRYPSDTLMENCTVDAGKSGDEEGRGSYGFAVYTPRYLSDSHEPDGGRHVFWNNDFKAPWGGVTLGGGGSSGSIFAHNRFVIEAGFGVTINKLSNDNVFLNNVFALKNWNVLFPEWKRYQGTDGHNYELGAVMFMSRPATGNRFIDNRFYGVSRDKLFVGDVGDDAPAQDQGNVVVPTFSVPERPKAPVQSLFEWQKAQKK